MRGTIRYGDNNMHLFDQVLSVSVESIEFEFRNNPFTEW